MWKDEGRVRWLGSCCAAFAIIGEVVVRAAVDRLDAKTGVPLALCGGCAAVAALASSRDRLADALPFLWAAAWIGAAAADGDAQVSTAAELMCVLPAIHLPKCLRTASGAGKAVLAEVVLAAAGVTARSAWPYSDETGSDAFLVLYLPFCVVAAATLVQPLQASKVSPTERASPEHSYAATEAETTPRHPPTDNGSSSHVRPLSAESASWAGSRTHTRTDTAAGAEVLVQPLQLALPAIVTTQADLGLKAASSPPTARTQHGYVSNVTGLPSASSFDTVQTAEAWVLPRLVDGVWRCVAGSSQLSSPLALAARFIERELSNSLGGSCAVWVVDPQRKNVVRASAGAGRGVFEQMSGSLSLRRRSFRKSSLRSSSLQQERAKQMSMPLSSSGVVAACCRHELTDGSDLAAHSLYDPDTDGRWAVGHAHVAPVADPCSPDTVLGCITFGSADAVGADTKAALAHMARSFSQPLGAALRLADVRRGVTSWRRLAEGMCADTGELLSDVAVHLASVGDQGRQALGVAHCALWLVQSSDDDLELVGLSDPMNVRSEQRRIDLTNKKSATECQVVAFLTAEPVHGNSRGTPITALPIPDPLPGASAPLGVLEVSVDGGDGWGEQDEFAERCELFVMSVAGSLSAFKARAQRAKEHDLLVRLVHVVDMLGRLRDLAPYCVALQRQVRDLVYCDTARLILVAKDHSYAECLSRDGASVHADRVQADGGPLLQCLRQSCTMNLRVYKRVEDAQLTFGYEEDFQLEGPLHTLLLCPVFDEIDNSIIAVIALANCKRRQVNIENEVDASTASESPASSPVSLGAAKRGGLTRKDRGRRLPPGYAEFSADDVKCAEMIAFNTAGKLGLLLREEAELDRHRLKEELQTIRRHLLAECHVHVLLPTPVTGAPQPSIVPPLGPPVPHSGKLCLALADGVGVWAVLEVISGDACSEARRGFFSDVMSKAAASLLRCIGPGRRRGQLGSECYRSYVERVAPWTLSAPRRQARAEGQEVVNASPTTAALLTPKRKAAEGRIVWRRGQLLGQGGFGTVHMAQNAATGELMACKTVVFNPADTKIWKKLAQLQSEIGLMKRLSHPAVVGYVGTERDGNEVHIFMEYVSGGSIADNLKQFGAFSPEVAAMYTQTMLTGLEYLHSQSPPVIHRDIKGANVLISRAGVAKLADLGSAALLNSDAARLGMQGTPQWMAPEVIASQPISTASDVWSIGCTVVEMLTARAPFSHVATTQMQILGFIIDEDEDISQVFPPDLDVQADVRSFVMQCCLQRAPELRDTTTAALAHPWLEHSSAAVQDDEDEVGLVSLVPGFTAASVRLDRNRSVRASVESVEWGASPHHLGASGTWSSQRDMLAGRLRGLVDEAMASSDPAVRLWAESIVCAMSSSHTQHAAQTPGNTGMFRIRSPRPPSLHLEGARRVRSQSALDQAGHGDGEDTHRLRSGRLKWCSEEDVEQNPVVEVIAVNR